MPRAGTSGAWLSACVAPEASCPSEAIRAPPGPSAGGAPGEEQCGSKRAGSLGTLLPGDPVFWSPFFQLGQLCHGGHGPIPHSLSALPRRPVLAHGKVDIIFTVINRLYYGLECRWHCIFPCQGWLFVSEIRCVSMACGGTGVQEWHVPVIYKNTSIEFMPVIPVSLP